MPFPDEAFTHRVVVSAYDERWPAEAATWLDLLQGIVPGALAVDHIGSTSVPGLPAKNCLDLMVQVADLDEESVVPALSARGFRLRPEPWNHTEVTNGVSHPKLVFAGPVGERSVNVHVRVVGGGNVRYALLFRDFLRTDFAVRDAWGAFKTRLAETVTDIHDYGRIKATAQPLLMRLAEAWATESGWSVPGRSPSVATPVLGVDGCKAGWVGVLLTRDGAEAMVADRIEDLITTARGRAPNLSVVAIDMPIGLPDHEPRRTDVGARARLPVGRKSSVFPTPSRAATRAASYLEANAANRSALGKGLSQQAFHLIPKIVQVDEYVRRAPAVTVIEAHPEVSFAEIDSACVVASKVTEAGRAARLAALRGVGIEPPGYLPGQGYAADDLLDACVVAWTAGRYAAAAAYSLPDPPEVFSDGIPAAIWV